MKWRTQSSFVYIDITHKLADTVKNRFPNIYEYCLKYGLDLTLNWIPVAPAAHYVMGGIQTDINGKTSINRLYTCGEVSSTGVHGANRLASNSLSEAVVFGRRIIHHIKGLSSLDKYINISEQSHTKEGFNQTMEKRLKLQKIMQRHVSLVRNSKGLEKVLNELKCNLSILEACLAKSEEFEFVLTCAHLTTQSALNREESKGGHYREDFPEKNDLIWLKRIVIGREKGFTEEFLKIKRNAINKEILNLSM
jgi:L-aspartate oxidase